MKRCREKTEPEFKDPEAVQAWGSVQCSVLSRIRKFSVERVVRDFRGCTGRVGVPIPKE